MWYVGVVVGERKTIVPRGEYYLISVCVVFVRISRSRVKKCPRRERICCMTENYMRAYEKAGGSYVVSSQTQQRERERELFLNFLCHYFISLV